MPTYVYKCEACGRTFEDFQSMSAAPLTKCNQENCSGSVRRVISGGAGILFKGSGFYQNDYRSDSYKKAASADKTSSSSESSSKTETKTKTETETKTEAKKEAKTESKSSKTKSES